MNREWVFGEAFPTAILGGIIKGVRGYEVWAGYDKFKEHRDFRFLGSGWMEFWE